MASEPKDFSLGAVLSVTTGRLLAPFTEVHDLIEHMASGAVWTHQLPRVADECGPVLLAQHPRLRQVVVPEDLAGAEAFEAWLAERIAEYGATWPVEPLVVPDALQ
jgi:hypothetical protein